MYQGLTKYLLYVLVFNSLAVVGLNSAWAEEVMDDDAAQTNSNQSLPSQGELDQLLAPIALYPDALLSHVLIASTYPLEVVMADRWAKDHPDLSGDAAINAAADEDWDPSVKALVAFPELLKRMSDDLGWTEALGEAFLADEKAVLDRVQNLRQHAYDAGNLKDAEHITVVQEEQQIIIQPRVREVIYVPYYDTRVVYGSWWWSSYPPVYWHDYYSYSRPVYWGPRVSLSWGFYFSDVRWSNRHIVVVNHNHFQRPRYYRDYSVSHHRYAEPWRHQVHHRRGVTYQNRVVNERYSHPHQRSGMSTSTQFTARLKEPRSERYSTDRNEQVRNGNAPTKQALRNRDALSQNTQDQRQQRQEQRQEQQKPSREEKITSREEKTTRSKRENSAENNEPRVRNETSTREQRHARVEESAQRDSRKRESSNRETNNRESSNRESSNRSSTERREEPRLSNKFKGGVARDRSALESASGGRSQERSARESAMRKGSSSWENRSQRGDNSGSRMRVPGNYSGERLRQRQER